MRTVTKRIGEVGSACGSLLRRPFNLPRWQGAALVLACVLFSFSAVRTRFDHHRFEAFLETAGAPGASVAFVTTAADCLALMEDVHELAGQLTVPTRIFVIEDGVSASDLDRLIDANSGETTMEPVPWRSVVPIGRMLRTPFAVAFREDGSVLFAESISGPHSLSVDRFRERMGEL